MAHTCPDCGCECHCKGDIDDICLDTPDAVNGCRHFLNPDCIGYDGEDRINPDPEEMPEMEEQYYVDAGAKSESTVSSKIYQIALIPFRIVSGIRYRIPVCCIFRYCIDMILLRCPGEERGCLFNKYGVFVPCGILHSAGAWK